MKIKQYTNLFLFSLPHLFVVECIILASYSGVARHDHFDGLRFYVYFVFYIVTIIKVGKLIDVKSILIGNMSSYLLSMLFTFLLKLGQFQVVDCDRYAYWFGHGWGFWDNVYGEITFFTVLMVLFQLPFYTAIFGKHKYG